MHMAYLHTYPYLINIDMLYYRYYTKMDGGYIVHVRIMVFDRRCINCRGGGSEKNRLKKKKEKE